MKEEKEIKEILLEDLGIEFPALSKALSKMKKEVKE